MLCRFCCGRMLRRAMITGCQLWYVGRSVFQFEIHVCEWVSFAMWLQFQLLIRGIVSLFETRRHFKGSYSNDSFTNYSSSRGILLSMTNSCTVATSIEDFRKMFAT
jgi:hypothetical protein